MSHEEFDNLVQNRVGNTEITPPAFVWQNVEEAIRQRKKKRAFFWWFGGGAALLAGFSLFHYLGNQQMPSNEALLIAANTKTESLVAATLNEVKPVIEVTNTTLLGVNNTSIENSTTYINKNINQNKAKSPSITSNKYLVAQNAEFQKKANDFLQSMPNELISDQITLDAPNPSENSILLNNEIDKKRTDKQIDLLAQKSILLEKNPKPYLNINPIKPFWRKKNNRNCYDFSGKDAVFMLEGYVSPLLVQRSLTANTSVGTEQGLIDKRNTTEAKSFAMSSGVRAAAIWGPFVFRTGINFNQFTEIFTYKNPNWLNVTTHFGYVDGKLVEIAPPTVEYGEKYIKSYNRFYFIDVPLIAGVEMRKGRVGVSLNGGISMNAFFGKRGSVLTANDEIIKVKPSKPTDQKIFKSNVGLSALGSVQTFYHYNAKTRLFVEPTFQGILKPVTSANYSLEQRYQMWGLKIGVARILDK
jgi:hypothetical protein